MDKPTPFDLEPAIRNWRQSLSASPAIRNCDLDELESHLRDSLDALQSTGLSQPEAFWVAASRIGGRDTLAGEFAKVNSERVWFDRVLWMVIGSLGVGMIYSLAGIMGYSASLCLYTLTHQASIVGPANLIMFLAVLLGACALIWRMASRGTPTSHPVFQWAKVHPVAAAILILLASVLLTSTRTLLGVLIAKTVPPTVMSALGLWAWPVVLISTLLWPAIMLWLVIKLAPKGRETA